MHIEAHGLIYDAAQRPDAERIAFFTGLCPLRSGTIMSGFQVGPGKHAATATIRLCRSGDGGNTWQEIPFRFETRLQGVPGSLAAAELVEAAAGRLLLFTTWFDRSDPTRPLFNPETEGILRSKSLLAVSTNEGATWGPWQELPTAGLTGCAGTGPPVRWSDGTIAYPFESFKEFDDPRPARHAAWLLVTRDGGQSFEPPFLVAQDPGHEIYYWDQRICPTRKAGEFIDLFWTHNRREKRDLNIHFLRTSIHDGKQAGSQPCPTSVPGQIAAPLLLDDGRVLAFIVDRGQPGTMKLWQSRDGGVSWPADACLTVHVHGDPERLSNYKGNVDFAQYWEDMGKWSFGHPAIRGLDSERVLLAYYAGTPERMSIHWARVHV
ncbi:MAG: exo-alpha-sialidase [Planctomycetes bacterium]|nr:exo-alpha-sialidase [Planctomycetota bacterium]